MKRTSRWRGHARGLILTLGVLGAAGIEAQSVADRYRVAGVDVPLELYLDSLAVVATEELTAAEVAAIGAQVLDETVGVRALAPRAWVIGFSGRARDELPELLEGLRSATGIREAGLVVRTAGADEPAVVTREVLVRFHTWASRRAIDSLNAALGVEVLGEPTLAPGLFLVGRGPGASGDALELAAAYLAHPSVLYAHPNFWLQDRPSDFFPDDPLFSDQWHLYNPGVPVALGDPRPDIHAPEAWDLTRGDPKVTIAILEQGGFDAPHPDLVDRLWQNPWMTGSGSGPQPFNKSGDLHGWNFLGCPTTSNPMADPCGTPDLSLPFGESTDHGTQVAGVAAAEGNNALGVSGACPNCRVMLVRIGFTTAYVRASAIDYARAMGADVMNMSFNTQYLDDTFILSVARAATEGRGHRGITIAAAPFDYSFDANICGTSPPLLAGQPDVISVIMSDDHDRRQLGAMGPCLDLMSPGVGIWTTTTTGQGPSATPDYASVNGNSFGAPVVAGVAGLLLSRNYELTRSEIYQILTTTADKVDAGGYGSDGHSDTHGYGRVNAWRALLAVPELAPDLDPDPAPIAPAGPEVGVRAGVTVLGGALSDRFLGAPGQGPMAAPVLYATLFPGAFLLDAQLGYARRWGPGTSAETRLHGALMLAYGYSFASGTLYAGPSLAVRSIDLGGGATTEWGVGGATGFRKPLSTHLAARLEASYRWWGGPGVNEWGLGLGFGVRLP